MNTPYLLDTMAITIDVTCVLSSSMHSWDSPSTHSWDSSFIHSWDSSSKHSCDLSPYILGIHLQCILGIHIPNILVIHLPSFLCFHPPCSPYILVAARKGDVGVVPLRRHHRLDAVGDQVARLQAAGGKGRMLLRHLTRVARLQAEGRKGRVHPSL